MTEKKQTTRRFRLIGLRGKLLLATLTLLIFPLASFSYLKELELFLKNNHSESVIVIAKTIASVFRDSAALIALNQLLDSPQEVLYSHPLKNTIVIDGYSDDWFALQNTRQYFQYSPSSPENAMSLLCANDDDFYYFSITVYKEKKLHNNSLSTTTGKTGEHPHFIDFQFLNYSHKIQKYRFKLDSPGWVNAYQNDPLAKIFNQKIRGEWQENSLGYTLEFKIPTEQINQQIAFQLKYQVGINKHQVRTNTKSLIESPVSANQLNPLISSNALNNFQLEQLVPDNTQLWLLNNTHHVSAKAKKSSPIDNHSLNNFSLMSLYRRLYLIAMNFPEQRAFYDNNSIQINNEAIRKTLAEKTTAEWLDNPHSEQLTLSVATPVYDNENNVIGTLLMEQSNNTLLALQDKTLERILMITLILFFSVALTLLFFSTQLLKRIINLRNDTEKAMSQEGEITNQLYRNDNDEIGDLARSFSTLLSRLEQHNQYLKSLSSKLSHELRTPLTIITSSLENMTALALSEESNQRVSGKSHKPTSDKSLQPVSDKSHQSIADESQKYTLRAKEGCARLNDLLNRMSEASRLEQSISTMEIENIEVVNFLNNYINAIQTANPDLKFTFNTSLSQQIAQFSPELIAQLLDKLLSNAISYHTIGTDIKLSLHRENKQIVIEVNNYGALIDEHELDSIFNSLTSYRRNRSQSVHLGLGLYIAKLISQFHKGRLVAKNNKDSRSVSFILSLPLK